MPAKVVPIFDSMPASAGQPNDDCIRDLERMLEMAKSGELQGFGCAYSRADGKVATVLQTNGNLFSLSHAIGSLWFRFQQRMMEESESEYAD